MRKESFILSVLVLFFAASDAQIANPVKWNYSAKKIGDKTYELHFTASIDGSWHLYSQDAGEDILSTTFSFKANPLVKMDGKVNESGELKTEHDPNLKLTLKYYYGQVDFIQKVKIKSVANTSVNGTVTYTVCSDKDNKCLPPKEFPFSIKIDGK